MEIRSKYAETVFLSLALIISSIFIATSFGYSDIAKKVPNICSIFLISCSVFRLGQLWLKDAAGIMTIKIHRRTLPFILLLLAYTASVFFFGFISMSSVFVPICMYWMGQRKFKIILSVTIIFMVLVYLTFVVGFRMPLPKSIIGF